MVRQNTSGRKPYKDLTFTDDYMFCRVLENDLELARQLLEVVLDKKIRKVELADPQHTISVDSDSRSVRLDVYLEDDAGTVFDLEMQTAHKDILPKRSRYYQSIMDIDHLATGMSYDELPETYVIFICMFDPCGKGLARYEFRSLCRDNPEIELADGTRKVFLNGREPASDLTRYIRESVNKAKTNRRWEREYVTVAEKIREERAEAAAEAHASSKAEDVNVLVEKLGMSVEEACDLLGCSIASYMSWRDEAGVLSDESLIS